MKGKRFALGYFIKSAESEDLPKTKRSRARSKIFCEIDQNEAVRLSDEINSTPSMKGRELESWNQHLIIFEIHSPKEYEEQLKL
ncbi:hypothetical protein RUM43_003908 [Polyplax serrata]|uniref:Uncharacterized protein n=1 Tax=Polyplax serrata TaxID=468196 RepID=A0AAN8S2I9_POLSC